MKRFLKCLVCLLIGLQFTACTAKKYAKDGTDQEWKLIFEDNFSRSGSFNAKKWSYAPRAGSAWSRFLTEGKEYVHQEDGYLKLRMDNRYIPTDTIPYHTGGIQTAGKFSFLYGKLEVRAKFTTGKGSWPAIWMMPEQPHAYGGWPKSGEIDVMEHVNNEPYVHQTIHSESETSPKGSSPSTKSTKYNSGDFNTYGIIWDPLKIEFYVNDQLTYTYHKKENATAKEWPFDKPFYIILNQSGGAGWPGKVDDKDLPFEMLVDYVRVYQRK